MSVIAIIAYDEMPATIRWQEYSLVSRGWFVPAATVPALAEALRPWRDRVEALYSSGNVVGFRVSSRVSPRAAYRLKELLLPFVKPVAGASDGIPSAPDTILTLSKHGLHIPARHVERAEGALGRLGDIQVKLDDDDGIHIVALGIPATVPLGSVFQVLSVDAVPIDPALGHRRKQMLDSLRGELERIETTRAERAC